MVEQLDPKTREAHLAVIASRAKFDPKTYEIDTSFKPGDPSNPLSVHTVPELVACLEANPKVEIEAKCLPFDKVNGTFKERGPLISVDRHHFIEGVKSKEKFKEFSGNGGANQGVGSTNSGYSPLGSDFVPLLGGPFNKQLYLQDYLQMMSQAFFAYHHDPIGHRVVETTVDFTLGRGVRIDCDNKPALAVIRAWEEVQNLPMYMRYFATELSMYGEILNWELPNFQTNIGYQLRPGQQVQVGLLPRFRLIDPSCIWDIACFPEDIDRVQFYQWVAPTQYQMYSGRVGDQAVPSFKFIYQQIAANEVDHWKVNCVSNEKRGRSDLFASLGYMKRLRDCVNWGMVALQKQAAWAIDTTIKGSQADIDRYVQDSQAQGTIAEAGSEFVHTDAVTREYVSNAAGKAGNHEILEWCLSMISAASGIPVPYFGTHLSGSTNKASALVSTEPVVKKFEMRQQVYEMAIKAMVKRVLKSHAIDPHTEIEITFPEIVVQDRSAKLKDLALAQSEAWMSKETIAPVAAKELNVSKFDWAQEKLKIDQEAEDLYALDISTQPLTAMPTVTPSGDATVKSDASPADTEQRGVSSTDRKQADNASEL